MSKLYLVVLSLLAGCAVGQPVPQQPLTPEQVAVRNQARQDTATCEYEAARSTPTTQTGYSMSSAISDEINDSMRRAKLIDLCLKAKGYGQY